MKIKRCCFTCVNWCADAKGDYEPSRCRLSPVRTKPTELCQRYFRDAATTRILIECQYDMRYDHIVKRFTEE